MRRVDIRHKRRATPRVRRSQVGPWRWVRFAPISGAATHALGRRCLGAVWGCRSSSGRCSQRARDTQPSPPASYRTGRRSTPRWQGNPGRA